MSTRWQAKRHELGVPGPSRGQFDRRKGGFLGLGVGTGPRAADVVTVDNAVEAGFSNERTVWIVMNPSDPKVKMSGVNETGNVS